MFKNEWQATAINPESSENIKKNNTHAHVHVRIHTQRHITLKPENKNKKTKVYGLTLSRKWLKKPTFKKKNQKTKR